MNWKIIEKVIFETKDTKGIKSVISPEFSEFLTLFLLEGLNQYSMKAFLCS